MERRGLIVLGLGAGALAVVLAGLDKTIDGDAFDAADFALEVVDRAVTLGAMVAVAWMTFTLRGVQADQAVLRQDLDRAVARGADWRGANGRALNDLAGAIRDQFEAWGLTPAEADIAGLMLKGVSLRDIAGLRRTSQVTIRQQAQGIYRKSGLAGRAELAAFFLESLFEDPEPDSGPVRVVVAAPAH